VACNIVVEGGGIASVWGIATLPETRRKGIGAAITLGPLLDSRAAGYRYAGLFATELGAPVYERIGFRHTGTRINRYMWRHAE
jgi:ribosomal protein S18 acetylase RimI-like enzyme